MAAKDEKIRESKGAPTPLADSDKWTELDGRSDTNSLLPYFEFLFLFSFVIFLTTFLFDPVNARYLLPHMKIASSMKASSDNYARV